VDDSIDRGISVRGGHAGIPYDHPSLILAAAVRSGAAGRATPLVCRGEIELSIAFHGHREGRGFAIVPLGRLVRAVRDILDGVVATRIRFGEIRRRTDYNRASHFGMYVGLAGELNLQISIDGRR
jgi:hypothetical protein